MIAQRDTIDHQDENSNQCPSKEILSGFLTGSLDTDAFNGVALHLNECDACRERLEGVPNADAWVDRFRSPPDTQFMDEADLAAAMVACVVPPQRCSEVSTALPPIDRIGPYELMRPLGRGGMGTVYLARDQTLKRLCAIKLLPRRAGEERFDREVQSLAAIDHPGVVTATDAGTHEGWRYLVMQHVEGIDLADVLESRGSLPVSLACRIGADIASAIAAIHHAKLIHRDVKPANVMLTHDGEIKVLDFGLAAAATSEVDQDRLTTVGDLVGTVAYAAPEQLAGSHPSAAVDWYALGSTLFRMITGSNTHPAAAQRGLTALMMAKSQCDWEPHERFDDGVDVEIRKLIACLLARDPANRMGNSDSIVRTLRRHGENDVRLLARVIGVARHGSDEVKQAAHVVKVSSSQKPPTNTRWKAVAAGFLGGAMTLAAVGWLIEVKSRNGTVKIETDQNDVAMRIAQRSGSETTSNKQVSSAAKLGYANIAPEKLNAVYRGKPVREHLDQLEVELDVETLVESLQAISRVIEEGDHELVRAMLIPARRYGGWTKGGPGPSERFMELSEVAYESLPNRVSFDLAIETLREGNDRSTAVIGWSFLMSSSWDRLPEMQAGDLDRLVDAANAYQSQQPAVTRDHQNHQPTIHERNLGLIRDRLIDLASRGVIEPDEIDGIQDWLPEVWGESAKSLEWLVDAELLGKLDEQIHVSVAAGEADKLPETEAWQAVWTKPWPQPITIQELAVAAQLGLQLPIALTMESVFQSRSVDLREELGVVVDVDNLTEPQKIQWANHFVLFDFQVIRGISNTGESLTQFDVNNFAELDNRAGQFQRPLDQARVLFASCQYWLPHLDAIRQNTTIPKTMDLVVQCLRDVLETDGQNDSAIANIAYEDLVNGYAQSGGGGMGGMWGSVPTSSTGDRAKAKGIAKVLDAYLSDHLAK